MAESESQSVDAAGGIDFAASNLDKLTDEIGNAGIFDRTDIHDPQQLLDYKRGRIEAEHQGLRGLVGNAYTALFGQPSYQQEMDELTGAQPYSAGGDAKSAAAASAQQEQYSLQQLRSSIDSAAASEKKTEFQRQGEAIEQNFRDQMQAANQVANGRTFQSQGFTSQAEANENAAHLRQAAATIHNAESDKLSVAKTSQTEGDRSRLYALDQAAAGDAGNSEGDSLRKELQRESQAANSNVNPLRDNNEGVPGLSDAVKRLDDAATKLDKALSNSKTVVLLKD